MRPHPDLFRLEKATNAQSRISTTPHHIGVFESDEWKASPNLSEEEEQCTALAFQ
jgi:hypothetical protein